MARNDQMGVVTLGAARMPVRVLGVDPGLTRCGLGVVDGLPGRPPHLVASGVVRTGADTSTDQRTGQSYYLVRIAMTADELGRLGDVKLTPGMPVEAFIQTGERTMLSYLVKPLHDQLMRSFREK